MVEKGIFTGKNESSFINDDEIKKRLAFPDKKKQEYVFEDVAEIIRLQRKLESKFEIGQREATWIVPSNLDKPIVIALITDPHFGSVRSNVDLFIEHLDMIENTPNMFGVFNGDDVDNFNATGKWASGMMENPVPPQIVSRSIAERYQRLDKRGKVGVISFGNHNDFGHNSGQDWYESFLGGFKCPVFTSGGDLHIKNGSQEYELALTHKYWGTSKLNPTNACKRYLDFESPNADIVFLGHTHQSEGLHFEKGGKDRIACIGGTYKDTDTFARKHGIGGRSGSPGWAVALWPDKRQMQLFKDLKIAQEFLRGLE